MAQIVLPIPYISSFEERVGGCGDFFEDLHANAIREISITDPN